MPPSLTSRTATPMAGLTLGAPRALPDTRTGTDTQPAHPLFFVERWALRKPARRWPLVAAGLLALWGLAGAASPVADLFLGSVVLPMLATGEPEDTIEVGHDGEYWQRRDRAERLVLWLCAAIAVGSYVFLAVMVSA